jgi:ABC-type transporter MlaC component
MKEGRTLGRSGRFAQLRPVILTTFGLLTMARLSVRSSWATLTDAQRQQMAETFRRYIAAQCSDRFDSYSGQKLEATEERSALSGVIVHPRS